MARCKAKTKAGKRCRRKAVDGGRCAAHVGAKMGRPTKLTPEVQAAICEALRAGNYAEVAARYAGIGSTTFYRWMERGAADMAAGKATPFSEFSDAIKKAETDAEVRAVAIIQKAMPKNWQAAMTYLERKFPKRWSRGERREVSGPEGGPIITKP